jgi:hypothetical protein
MATRFATVGDQMLVALANFWLTVAIGRAFHAEELAAYGIGLSAGLMVQALQRHAVVIPRIVWCGSLWPADHHRVWRLACAVC